LAGFGEAKVKWIGRVDGTSAYGAMKANTCFHHAAALTAALLLSQAVLEAQIPPSASMTIVPSGTTSNRVTIRDPGNHLWILEATTNLNTWNEVAAWKIHNGDFSRTLPKDPGEKIFYRAFNDAARTDVLSTTANALRLPVTPFNYSPPLPPHYMSPQALNQDNTPTNNPVTNLGATLGRVLFYDKRLSINGTVSCASCHQPQHGFSDPRQFSVGFNGGMTDRNSMGLANARYYARERFFWDERAATLEDQVMQPIQNAVEMGMTLPALVTRLAAEPFYTNLFALTFGSPQITTNGISRALAQFVRSMVSTQSKYDQGIPVAFTNFTAQEQLGRQIFLGQVGNATCAACHGPDTFSAPNIFNNGLEFPYVDLGVGGVTGNPQENGLFKTPSLRNIELTAPYMHDGRFATLEEVVEFYNSGVVLNPNLPPALRAPPMPGQPPAPRRLNLTNNQKAALVAFLRTMTDTNLTNAVRFSDPFNYGN
jgi:cytochrome c peroxidase